jgi:hypothetical protein
MNDPLGSLRASWPVLVRAITKPFVSADVRIGIHRAVERITGEATVSRSHVEALVPAIGQV